MNYVVIDLEFNQDFISKKSNRNIQASACPFEIIQIGAIKLDNDFNKIAALNRIVKPEVYPTVHPYVKQITGLTTEQLSAGLSFNEVYEEFLQLTEGDKTVLCVWGTADIKELFRNIEYHGLDTNVVPKNYINIQSYASKYLQCAKGTNIGLSSAVDALNITARGSFHDAFNDACYTADIFKAIYNKNIKPKTYTPFKDRKNNPSVIKSHKVDYDKLIEQFEKMYSRKMTSEEKDIVRLAYMMGKTNQFQIKTPDKQ